MALVQVVALVEDRAKVEIGSNRRHSEGMTGQGLGGPGMLGPTGQDTFTRDRLPAPEDLAGDQIAGLRLSRLAECRGGTDRGRHGGGSGFGDHTALIGDGRSRTYKELTDWTNRLAHALVEDYGVKPGNRVLIRSANNPAMVACWLAATKAGAVVVNTMPMLRAGELEPDRRQGRDCTGPVRHKANGGQLAATDLSARRTEHPQP